MKTVINDLYKTFTKNTQKLFDVDQLEQFFLYYLQQVIPCYLMY